MSFESFCARKHAKRSKFFLKAVKNHKRTIQRSKRKNQRLRSIWELWPRKTWNFRWNASNTPTELGTTQKDVEKHARFNKNLVDQRESYSLLYFNCKEIASIHGRQEPFTLKRYKEETDKPYCRIIFFLCSTSEYRDSVFRHGDNETDSIDDELPGVFPTYPLI